jgi:hypothetical protein
MRTSEVAQDGSPVAVYLALLSSPEFDPTIEAMPLRAVCWIWAVGRDG